MTRIRSNSSTKDDAAPTHESQRLEVCGCCGSNSALPAGSAQGVPILRCASCKTLRFESIAPPQVIYQDGYHLGETGFGWNYVDDSERNYEDAKANKRLELIERYRPPGRLVDVGGGIGLFAAAASRRGWDAEVLEPVSHAVDFARKNTGVKAIQGTADKLRDYPGRYDLVSFLHCIEHIPEARETLQVARRALVPGGHLFIEVPNVGSLARRLQGDLWLGWQAGEHAYLFERRTLAGLVQAAGFEPLFVRTFVPGWHGLLPDGYAHMLGLQGPLYRILDFKRRHARRPLVVGEPPLGDARETGAFRTPVPIREQTGFRRFIYQKVFDRIAWLEEALGVGTFIQILARSRQ